MSCVDGLITGRTTAWQDIHRLRGDTELSMHLPHGALLRALGLESLLTTSRVVEDAAGDLWGDDVAGGPHHGSKHTRVLQYCARCHTACSWLARQRTHALRRVCSQVQQWVATAPHHTWHASWCGGGGRAPGGVVAAHRGAGRGLHQEGVLLKAIASQLDVLHIAEARCAPRRAPGVPPCFAWHAWAHAPA